MCLVLFLWATGEPLGAAQALCQETAFSAGKSLPCLRPHPPRTIRFAPSVAARGSLLTTRGQRGRQGLRRDFLAKAKKVLVWRRTADAMVWLTLCSPDVLTPGAARAQSSTSPHWPVGGAQVQPPAPPPPTWTLQKPGLWWFQLPALPLFLLALRRLYQGGPLPPSPLPTASGLALLCRDVTRGLPGKCRQQRGPPPWLYHL